MDTPPDAHTQHYTAGDLDAAVAAALAAPAPDDTALALAALAELDQFHTGGVEATRALAERAAITAADHVLDVGGGLGGPARLLAHERGCQVTVLDLTEAYCRAGERLSAWAGLADRVRFRHGDALALPFDAGSFDVVWTQHSSMNIADKRRLYAELARVLRPGGRLALFEVVAGSGEPLHFPVLWARSADTSFLVTPEALRATLADAGLQERSWQDVSEWALAWLSERQRALVRREDQRSERLRQLGAEVVVGAMDECLARLECGPSLRSGEAGQRNGARVRPPAHVGQT